MEGLTTSPSSYSDKSPQTEDVACKLYPVHRAFLAALHAGNVGEQERGNRREEEAGEEASERQDRSLGRIALAH